MGIGEPWTFWKLLVQGQVALLEGQLVLARIVNQLALGEVAPQPSGPPPAPPAPPAAPRPRYGLRLQEPQPAEQG